MAKEFTILNKNDRTYRTKLQRSLFGFDSAVGRIQAVCPVLANLRAGWVFLPGKKRKNSRCAGG